MKRDTIEKSRSWGSLSQERISPSGQPHGTSWYGLSNKQTHKSVQKQYTAQTSTLKLYIEVMKNQIYVQTKQNIQTDAMHTRINSINRKTKATNFWKYQNATLLPCYYNAPTKTEHHITIICNQNTENIVRIIKGTQHTAGTIHSTSLINPSDWSTESWLWPTLTQYCVMLQSFLAFLKHMSTCIYDKWILWMRQRTHMTTATWICEGTKVGNQARWADFGTQQSSPSTFPANMKHLST